MKTSKLIVLISFILMAFTVGDSKSEFLVPYNANSIFINDIDLDGDEDIITGHLYNFSTEWGGFALLENENGGNYILVDSVYIYIYIYSSQNIIYSANIKNDEYPEILGRYYNNQKTNVLIIELNNGNYIFDFFPMCDNLTDFNIGDVSGNNALDIPFISNNDFLWGIIYNDGTGNFSSPEYYDLTFPPVDITCGDLNNDGMADVVVCGSVTEIYFSTDTGFQQLVLTTTLSHDVLISDFDNDGDNDVITHTTFVYPNHRVYMFENLGNEQFFEHDYFQFSPFCSYVQIADFNNDSLPDMVFIEQFGDGLQYFYNQGEFQLGDQTFIPVTFPSLKGLACGDLDNNNYNDIAVTHSQGSQEMYAKLLFNDGNGNFLDNPITSTIETDFTEEITGYSYPNPFEIETTIKFTIKENSHVELFVLNLSGRLIKSLINKNMKGGTHSIKWSGTDMTGQACSPGSYIACLKANKDVLHCFKLIKY